MSLPFLATYEDVLLDMEGFVRTRGKGIDQSTIRGCVETALREIVAARDWRFFKRKWRVALDGAETDGTVTYLASTGTYPYEVTLTGATWPSWAAQGEILIEGVVCEVDARKSTTVLTLKFPRVPVDDASAVAYTLGRSQYPLPAEYAGIWTPAEKTPQFIGRYRTMDELAIMEKYRTLTGTVQYWSIGPATDYYGSQALYVYPWPSADSAEDMLLKFRPRSLVVSGKESWNYAGTVSVAEDGTTVTGVGTSFRSLMEGAIIRFSDTTTRPTSQTRSNPYVFQQSIASVTDTTHLELSAASSTALSSVAYNVSDPVDLVSHMYDAFVKNCHTHLAYAAGMDYPQTVRRHYLASLQVAKSADSQTRQPSVAGIGGYRRSRLADFKSRDEEGYEV